MTWRPTLRLAARDARRAKARSALIVAMIALPVLALAFADVTWRTAVAGPQEQLTRDLGAADAALSMRTPAGDNLIQAADPRPWNFASGGGGAPANINDLTLPRGLRLLVEDQRDVDVTTVGGTAPLSWTEVDAADSTFIGRWSLEDGRYPSDRTEVTLTPAMAERTGLAVGDTLELVQPEARYEVVGLASKAGSRELRSAVALPGTLIGAPDGLPPVVAYAGDLTGFLAGGPVSWEDVLALNKQGAVVTSRAVIADPPPTTEFDQFASSATTLTDYLVPVLVVAMVVGLSGLIVVLLAGTAFAVGARRQVRSLALVAASGGGRRDLRRVVLSGGLVLGVVAGFVGVILGVTLAAVVVQLIWHFNWIPDTDLASFDVRPLELLPIAVVGVVTGVLAAVIPARQASRMDVVAALRGRSGAGPRSRRTPVVGTVMVLVGIVLSVLGSGWVVAARNDGGVTSQNLVVGVLVGGAALVLLGLVVCAGSVVSLVARIAPRLPLAGRLALRDAERHRGRTAPAVAAVLTAVSGSVAVMLYVAALDQQDRENYTAASPAGTSTVMLTTWVTDPKTGVQSATPIDPALVITALSSMHISAAISLNGPALCDGTCASVDVVRPRANRCPIYDEEPWDTEGATTPVPPEVPNDPRCNSQRGELWAIPHVAVGGAELLDASGHPASAAAKKVLAAGGVVVTDPQYIDADGTVRLKYYSRETLAQTPPPGQEFTWTQPPPDRVIRVPASYVPADESLVPVIVSPNALEGMDVDVTPLTLIVRNDGPVSDQQEDAANAALARTLGSQVRIWVERGYESTYGLGLLALALAAGIVTLGATGIATGLALTDARADHATLAAVGAAPRVRRRLAAAQAIVVALLGVLLGIAAGVVPALSIIGAVPTLQVVWPLPQLLALVVGVPLLAGAAAYVFTRSKVPMQRRLAT